MQKIKEEAANFFIPLDIFYISLLFICEAIPISSLP